MLLYVALPFTYVVLGRLGLLFALPPGYATAIFLPAGIAVAAMFVAGSASLPGTFFGSFLLNAWISHSITHQFDNTGVSAALIIAVSSMIQAAAGGALLRKFIGYPTSFDNLQDHLLFLLLVPAICVISPTLSLSGLKAVGVLTATDVTGNWITWWVGDALGVLVALPLVLVFLGEPQALWRSRMIFVAVPMTVCFGIFVAIYLHINRWQSEQSLAEFRWAVLSAGALSTGLLGSLLLLGTGHAYRLKKLANQILAQEQALAAELKTTTILRDIGAACGDSKTSLQTCLALILEGAIACTRADKGNIQVINVTSGMLEIVAHSGFQQPFLEFFASVTVDDPSACAVAVKSRGRIVVDDITKSNLFAGEASLPVLLGSGVRAVQSTPILDSNGAPLGVISTHFVQPHRSSDQELRVIDLISRLTADYLERKHDEERTKLLVSEIQHRTNNLLTVIQSIANRSLSVGSLPDAKRIFDARLKSLARTHAQLTKSDGQSIDLRAIIQSELESFASQITIQGQHVLLGYQQAQQFTLVVHELTTNAVKYGALSVPSGSIYVGWMLARDGERDVLKFHWQEREGPVVSAPTGQGFGTTLLRAMFSELRLEYPPEGFGCNGETNLAKAVPAFDPSVI
jgi:two-component sensor histidine kinase